MKLRLQHGLPYVTVQLRYREDSLTLENVLLDTGSASSIFAADLLADIHLHLEPDDHIQRIRGVGGAEFVFTKRLDALVLGDIHLAPFDIEVGAMDYGFDLSGILGMDFLLRAQAIIDLEQLEIYGGQV